MPNSCEYWKVYENRWLSNASDKGDICGVPVRLMRDERQQKSITHLGGQWVWRTLLCLNLEAVERKSARFCPVVQLLCGAEPRIATLAESTNYAPNKSVCFHVSSVP
eukprot:1191703-Prorocentrum_minimum.AAC.2